MKTLPSALLTHSALLILPEASDAWKAVSGSRKILLSRVHVQFGEGARSLRLNDEQLPQAELWYDCRLSRPAGLDLMKLFAAARRAGAPLVCRIGETDYIADSVQLLTDARGRAHHWHMTMGSTGRTSEFGR